MTYCHIPYWSVLKNLTQIYTSSQHIMNIHEEISGEKNPVFRDISRHGGFNVVVYFHRSLGFHDPIGEKPPARNLHPGFCVHGTPKITQIVKGNSSSKPPLFGFKPAYDFSTCFKFQRLCGWCNPRKVPQRCCGSREAHQWNRWKWMEDITSTNWQLQWYVYIHI